MKKIILTFIAIVFIGCSGVEAVKDYFCSLTANQTEGTTETVFEFTVDTNDEILSWMVDGVEREIARSVTESFTFTVGTHEVSVITSNGAEDSIEITVTEIIEEIPEEPIIEEPIEDPVQEPVEEPKEIVKEYVNRYIVTGVLNGQITDLEYNYPILRYGIVDFNLETMTPGVNGFNVMTEYTETERIIYLHIGCDNNALALVDSLNSDGISQEEFNDFMNVLYTNPDPVEVYDTIMYCLQGMATNTPDTFDVTVNSIIINGVSKADNQFPHTISDNIKIVQVVFNVDTADHFFFYNGNYQNFFGDDLSCLTRDQLIKASEILDAYPETGILELMEVYPK